MIIKTEHDYSHLITDNLEIKHKFWEGLRFRDRDYFHNRRYRQGLWDGYIEFFNLQSGRFLTGLLPIILASLKKLDIEYEVVDQREQVKFKYDKIDDQFLNQWGNSGSQITLRDYQVDFINKVIKHQRGVIYAPTSAGKTAVMVGILKTLPPEPTLVLQNRKGLAQQNYQEISNWGFDNVGTLWGGAVNPSLITVATVQSVDKIVKLLPKIKILIVDEIHDMMSSVPIAVYRRLKNCGVRVALSATPFKFGETDKVQKYRVKGYFGGVLKTASTETGILTTKELQDREILSPSKCTFYPINEPQIPHDVYIDAITHGIAESTYFNHIVSRLARKQKGRTLILVDRIAQGDTLHAMIADSLWVQGKDTDKTRQHVIKELQKSPHVVAIATQQIFNTGVNFYCHNLINAASGKAEHLVIQRIGRGLRTANDKDILNYYDFIFNINDYLLDHSWKRIKIFRKEGHEVIIKEEIDF